MKDKNKYITIKDKGPVVYWTYTIVTKLVFGFGIAGIIYLFFVCLDKIMSALYNVNPELPLWTVIAVCITGVLIAFDN